MKNWKYSFSLLLRRIAKRKDRVRLRPNRGSLLSCPAKSSPMHRSGTCLLRLAGVTRRFRPASVKIENDWREERRGQGTAVECPYLRRPRFTNSLFRPPLLLLIVCYFHSRIFIFLPAA